MKTLFIMRHAKSSWDDASVSDFERPLNRRGLKAAPFMGELMRSKDLVPDVIVSSTAMRTRQTAEIVKDAGGFEAEIEFHKRIYEASTQDLLGAIVELSDKLDTAMLVGHNPGMEGFVWFLTGQLKPMRTAALAVIELNVESWSDIDHGFGELKSVFHPKDEM